MGIPLLCDDADLLLLLVRILMRRGRDEGIFMVWKKLDGQSDDMLRVHTYITLQRMKRMLAL